MLYDRGTAFWDTLLRASFDLCVNHGRCVVEANRSM